MNVTTSAIMGGDLTSAAVLGAFTLVEFFELLRKVAVRDPSLPDIFSTEVKSLLNMSHHYVFHQPSASPMEPLHFAVDATAVLLAVHSQGFGFFLALFPPCPEIPV